MAIFDVELFYLLCDFSRKSEQKSEMKKKSNMAIFDFFFISPFALCFNFLLKKIYDRRNMRRQMWPYLTFFSFRLFFQFYFFS
jgi:hypothetical protein